MAKVPKFLTITIALSFMSSSTKRMTPTHNIYNYSTPQLGSVYKQTQFTQ